MLEAALLVGSYLLGSIPFGLIVGKLWKGIDIRQYGSGNIGATNTMRALGLPGFIVVFLLDAAKGLVPVLAARSLSTDPWVTVGCGMLAIVGHTLSLFLRFRGGRGAATSLGVIIGLAPSVAAIGFASWALVVAVTRYVSLASITGAVVMPALIIASDLPIPYKVFSAVAGILVIVKHRANIGRLLQGREAKWGQKVKVQEGDDGKG